jgi:hypothetical protein
LRADVETFAARIPSQILLTMLLPHQQKVFECLLETAEILFEGRWRSLAVRPRFSRLLVGPSGIGKSYVARAVADKLDLPILNQEATNWIPLGASERAAKQTWSDILVFLRNNERGIIFLDELDKLVRHDNQQNCSWLHFVRVEIFGLLDRRIPESLLMNNEEGHEGEPQLLRQRLRNGFMIIAAGAFQDYWDTCSRPTVGFKGNALEADAEMDHKKAATYVATEIINRLEGPVLALRPLDLDDYRIMLDQMVAQLPASLGREARDIGSAELAAAVESGLGVRWLEQIVYRALVKQRTCTIHKSRKRGDRSPAEVLAAALRPPR